MRNRARYASSACALNALTYPLLLACIGAYIRSGTPHQIATVNPEFVMLARRDREFGEVLEGADLCMPDGIGLLWAARRLGQALPERVTGSDGLPIIAQEAAKQGWRLYLLGAAPGVAGQAAAVLAARFEGLSVAGTFAGSPSDADAPALVARIRAAAPQILFVAFGAPAQDLWIHRYKAELAVPVMLGVGGAFDHLAGVRRRAPRWVQRLNLEWLFRLITQPWRWRRQLALPEFAWLVAAASLRKTRGVRRPGRGDREPMA